MVGPLTEDTQQKLPLLGRIKGRGDHHVGAGVEREETKHRAPVGERDGPCLLLDHMHSVGTVLLHLCVNMCTACNTTCIHHVDSICIACNTTHIALSIGTVFLHLYVSMCTFNTAYMWWDSAKLVHVHVFR